MTAKADIILDNDDVVVHRVRSSGRGPVSSGHQRRRRLIVYLKDAHITRTEAGHREDITRKAGDVVWRPASEHAVEHAGDGEHEILIIEFKQ